MSNKTEVIEVDAAVTEAVAKEVNKELDTKLDAFSTKLQETIEKMTTKEEVVVDKGARGGAAIEGEVVSKFEDMTKEQFASEQLRNLVNGNRQKLAEMNAHAYKTQYEAGIINKATYQNAGTNADGGYLVPSSELYGDVLSTLSEYSVFTNELAVVTLQSGDTLDVSTLVGDAVVTEVGSEGGTKDDTKVTFGQTSITVREFAGIVGFTKQWVRQSSMDVYDIIRRSMARAIAKKREELAITDGTSGVVSIAGTDETVLTAGNTAVADITWANVKAMPYNVPTQSANGGIYVISRLALGALDTLSDTTGQDIVTLDAGSAGALTGRFKNGYRFVVAETLGTTDAVSTTHIVFGNFKKYGVLLRQGAIENDLFDTGSYNDGTADHNLLSQNKMAWRTAFYENVGYPIPAAFTKLTTAAV